MWYQYNQNCDCAFCSAVKYRGYEVFSLFPHRDPNARDHCCYCDKSLYQMTFNPQTFETKSVDDKVHIYNSEDKRICTSCDQRLIRRGTVINCHSCDKPIYTMRGDTFKTDVDPLRDFEGIAPQKSPKRGIINKCVHCRSNIGG